MDKILRIGIIGAGRIGKLHADNLTKRVGGVKLVAVSDVYKKSAEDLAAVHNIPNVYDDYNDLLANKEVDAVFVCSSTDTHAPISIAAAKAGKHIFCEKPIDLDLKKIEEVIEVVKKTGVKFQVGFNRRFDRNFKQVHDVALSGQLGDVHIVKITSRDPEPPPLEYVKVSGGIFADMTIHDFDILRYVTGSEVVEVSAVGTCLVNPDIGKLGDVDTCIITLRMANGALGVIDNSRQSVYGYDQRVEVFGSKGQIAIQNETLNNAVISTKDGIVSEKPLWFFLERYNDAFIEETRLFVEACLENKDVPAGAFDGLQSIKIAMAAKESVQKGGIPVKVN